MVTYSLKRDRDEAEEFHSQLEMVLSALEGTFGKLGPDMGRLVDVPAAPWSHSNFWAADQAPVPDAGGHPLLGRDILIPRTDTHVWSVDVGTDRNPWLNDHRVHGMPVMPAAAFIEVCLGAASEAFRVGIEDLELRDFNVERMLVLDKNVSLTTHLQWQVTDRTVEIEIFSRSGADEWLRHAGAVVICADKSGGDGIRIDRSAAGELETSTTKVPVGTYYSLLRQTGQQHGPGFAALTSIERHGGGRASTTIELPPAAPQHLRFIAHPVILDAALQSIGAALSDTALPRLADATYLPESIESLRILEPLDGKIECRVDLRQSDDADRGIRASAQLVNDAGRVVAEFAGISLKRVASRKLDLPIGQKVFDTKWTAEPLKSASVNSVDERCWILLTESGELPSIASSAAAAIDADQGRVFTAQLADERSLRAAFESAAGGAGTSPAEIVVFVDPSRPGEAAIAAGLHARRRRSCGWPPSFEQLSRT